MQKNVESFLERVLRAPANTRIADRYQIQTQLGKQSGRITLLARDLETQQSVVLKLLLFDSNMGWDDLKLFEREIETLKFFSHPKIPRYLDSFELEFSDCKGIVLVQSYIKAKSLETSLEEGRRFSELEIEQIVKSLLRTLADLHRQRPPIIHRDIKPSNILLGEGPDNRLGAVYLVDFGAVQTLARQEGQTVTVVGTYGYMPPELFGGRATPASDLYSVGATAIALSCGIHPADLPQAGMRLDFARQVQLSPSFVRWLEQMVEPSLDRRFSSAEQALEALERPPIEKKNVTRLELLWNCLWRSAAIGTLAGTIYGRYHGGFIGFLVGVSNGVFIGNLTFDCFFPLNHFRAYQIIAILSSILIGTVASLGLVVVYVNWCPGIAIASCIERSEFFRNILAPVLGLSMGAISHNITRWYARRSQE